VIWQRVICFQNKFDDSDEIKLSYCCVNSDGGFLFHNKVEIELPNSQLIKLSLKGNYYF
jgi:hypothetical protein